MRVLQVRWQKNGRTKIYGSLEAFLEEHLEFTGLKDKINYKISRLKKPYEDENVRIERFVVIRGKRKEKIGKRLG